MTQQRWLRIIPVAFIMYTIAFVDRTNISLALPDIARDLHMNPEQSGNAAGIFFWGYIVLQIPGGYLAEHWSAKRFVAVLLVVWWMSARPVAGPSVRVAASVIPDTVLVRFELSAPDAHEVSLAGSFNRWEAPGIPLRRSTVPGLWPVPVPLPDLKAQFATIRD